MMSRVMKLSFSEHGRNCVENYSRLCGRHRKAAPPAPAARIANGHNFPLIETPDNFYSEIFKTLRRAVMCAVLSHPLSHPR